MTSERNKLRGVLREKFPRNHGELLPALHFLQHEFGYLPGWGMEVISWHLGIPASEVYGAATSYTEFRLEKPGAHVIKVCTGLSCRINGSSEIMDMVIAEIKSESLNGISDDEISVETTGCGFLCAMAPAVMLDGEWWGRLTPDSVLDLIRERLKK